MPSFPFPLFRRPSTGGGYKMTRLSDARLETMSLLRDGFNITRNIQCKDKASQSHFCMLAFIIFLACAIKAKTTDRHQTVKQPKKTRCKRLVSCQFGSRCNVCACELLCYWRCSGARHTPSIAIGFWKARRTNCTPWVQPGLALPTQINLYLT